MKIPDTIKELIWAFYPLRYKSLSEKTTGNSLKYMTRMLAIAFVIAGLVLVPKVAMLQSEIQGELEKFDKLSFSTDAKQTSAAIVPMERPWIIIDLNSNVSLKNELLVIDKETIQFRFFNIKKFSQEELKNAENNPQQLSELVSTLVLLLVPGVALFTFIRTWLKYLLLSLAIGTFFFLITDLTRYRMKWKEMMSVSLHAITPMIFLEVVSSSISSEYLIPLFPFLGVKVYAITTLLFTAMMVLAVIGCRIEDSRK